LEHDEARVLTDEVKREGRELWRKLVALYHGGAHIALGYSSWHSYCEAEFEFKQAQAYRQLHAGSVDAILQLDNGASVLNEAQARELAPLRDQPEHLREAWAEASADGAPTAAKVREAVGRRMDPIYSSGRDDWETPQAFFDALDAEFGFDLDVCALPASAKCERFFTPDDDGLAQEWTGTCWMNPPYGDEIARWVRKAWEAAQAGATVVCLVPARVDTGWWWDYCRFGEVRFLRGRLRFGGGTTGAPFPSAVVVFGYSPDTVYWEREAA
jgi:phage N-6-adenine-methyltransferase